MTENGEQRKRCTKFTDTEGHVFDLALDAVLIQEVREAHQLDLADVTDPETWRRLDQDPVLQVDVLQTLLADQLKVLELDGRAFAKAIGPGDVLDQAYTALLDAIELFIPPRRRLLWRALCDKNQTVLEAGLKLAIKKVEDPRLQEEILDAMGARMDSEVETQLTRLRSATTTQEPAASDPTD